VSNFTESQKNALVDQTRTMLFYTELSANSSKLYSFSNAEAGTSKWSFGLLQFDVGSNATAQGFLKGIGFTSNQITELKGSATPSDLQSMNNILAAHKTEIDQYTDDTVAGYVASLDHIVDYVAKFSPSNAAAIVNDSSLQLAILDYNNQFNIGGLNNSTPPANGMLSYLCGNSVSLAGGTQKVSGTLQFDNIQNYINNTTYGVNNTTAVNSRVDRYNTAMDKIDSGQLIGSSANASLSSTFLDGVDALTGDLTENNLGDGLFSVIGTNGQVKSQITQNQTAAPYVESTTYTNGQTSVTVNGNGDIINISGATVNIAGNSSVNVFGSNDTVTATGGNTNFGVYGGNDTINSQVGANVWTGNQGSGGAVNTVNANGAYVTVVESSNVSSNGASNVDVRQDSAVVVNGNNEAVHLLGDNNQLQIQGTGDTTTVSGNYDTTTANGANDTTINNGSYDVTENFGNGDRTYDYGSYDHDFNFGYDEYVWSDDSTDTSYNANHTDTGDGNGSYGYGGYGYGGYGGYGGYYGYYGYYGTSGKSQGKGSSNGVNIGALVEFDKSHGDNKGAGLAAKAWAQVQSAISDQASVVTAKAKWDHEVVTWSFAQSGGQFSGSMDASQEQAVQKAFTQWADATGLTFQEVSGSTKSDIKIGWGNFDTADTGVVGFTTLRAKNGDLAGAVVRLENPTDDALVANANGGQVYASTDASFDQVLLHEIGHAIGFGDNADSSSIESYALTGANRTLSSNDIAAAGSLYAQPVLTASTEVSAVHADSMIQAMSSFAPSQMAHATPAANDPSATEHISGRQFYGHHAAR
jgi:predicted Zn-dependent protease